MVSSLSELSVTAVVNYFESICIKTPFSKELNGILTALSFPDVFLPPAVADTLLDAVLRQRVIHGLFMWVHPFFDTKKCRLTRVVLPRLGRGRYECRVLELIINRLAQHNLLELSVDPSWCFSRSIWDTLSEKNPQIASLKALNLRNVRVTGRPGFESLAHLHHLRLLNLSGTLIGNMDANNLLKNMTSLEVLELAQTSILLAKLDLSPVAQTLRYLNVKDLLPGCTQGCPSAFHCLPVLQHLDVGQSVVKSKSLICTISDDLIDAVIAMPSLTSVDFSCTKVLSAQIEKLVSAKGLSLKFLGLLGASLQLEENTYPDHVTVTGVSCPRQIVATLETQHYHVLPDFMIKCLRALFALLRVRDIKFAGHESRITQIIIQLLQIHNDNNSFLVAASACLIPLFEALTFCQCADDHHTKRLMTRCVDRILLMLESLESFREHQPQLHVNCYIFLSTAQNLICGEKYQLERVARVLVQNIRQYKSESIRVRALRFLRSVVYQIDTVGRTVVGESGFCQLLKDIVMEKAAGLTEDQELTHVLSAIWSLTDENVPNCNLLAAGTFVEDMLNLFQVCSEPSTHLKIHGGLGNLLEVPSCRKHLMRDDYCQQFIDMLLKDDTSIEFKFESAHAFVNLAMQGEEEWSLTCISFSNALQLVERQVQHWEIPSDLRCAYRTFQSQLTLLEQSELPAVHLYALWTIANFCYYQGERYVPMLISDQGVPIVKKYLTSSFESIPGQGHLWNCQQLAAKILKAVEESGEAEAAMLM